uniref:RRM domain-containing protein n=1 Tax=Romanomermis culicivorax TaxID=13658 RepID=A0A915J6H6_ROMCU
MPGVAKSAEEQFRKIFIGGLTFTTTDEMLKEFYGQYGEIVDCIVMKDPATKKSRGFGFVTFAESDSVDKAMSSRPHTIDSRQVEPKRAIPRESSGKAESNLSVKRLYVSGVRDDHTEEMFREHFGQYGNVVEIEIMTDKVTGKKRGFAFITFDDYDAVDKCVLQKSHMIDNKRCDVKKALTRDEMKKSEMGRDRYERDMRSRGTGRNMGDYGPPGRYGADSWNQGWGYGNGMQQQWGGQQSWGKDSAGMMSGGYGGAYGAGGGYQGGNQGWAPAPQGGDMGWGAGQRAGPNAWGAQAAGGNQGWQGQAGGWGQQGAGGNRKQQGGAGYGGYGY